MNTETVQTQAVKKNEFCPYCGAHRDRHFVGDVYCSSLCEELHEHWILYYQSTLYRFRD